jgi:hypothetical protein
MTTSAISETNALFVDTSITSTTGSGSRPRPFPQDETPRLSPLAEILRRLHQLLQQNPIEYARVTQRIAASLQSAAATAQADGNTTAASQFHQLAVHFTKASQSGELPDAGELAAAIFGEGGHYSPTDFSDGAMTAHGALNPLAIILNALSS